MSLNNVKDRITSTKNYENLIVKIYNFIIENGITRNLKLIKFHADDINSVKIYKCILRKVE